MIALDISLLNLKSPYYVVQDHLFLRWFNTYEHRDLYEIRTVEDVMDDKTPNYGAIIVEKTHPDLELILARFDELATFLKKPLG